MTSQSAPLRTSRNTDGTTPDNSDDVRIENVDMVVGDDCISIKSGWNQAVVAYGVPAPMSRF
jgi:polygalacturonase